MDLRAPCESLAESAFGALLPALVLWGGGWLYYKVRHREGLGFGDVKLIAMVGSFLGLRGALLTLILGSICGSVLGYGYIKATGKDAATYELPFGTFLGAAALAGGHRGAEGAGVVRGAVGNTGTTKSDGSDSTTSAILRFHFLHAHDLRFVEFNPESGPVRQLDLSFLRRNDRVFLEISQTWLQVDLVFHYRA